MGPPAVNVLSLCSGSGGLELGIRIAEPRSRCVAYIEREAYAVALLAARMEQGWLDPAPVWSDLATFDGRPWRGVVDCVAASDPCRANSRAGKRRGEADDEWLLDEVLRVVAEVRPRRFFRENVEGNAAGQLASIVPPLERLGYCVAAGLFEAPIVGASQRRCRLFIVADIDGDGLAATDQEAVPVAQLSDDGGGELACVDRVGGDARPESEVSGEERPLLDDQRCGMAVERFFPPRPSDATWSDVAYSDPLLAPAVGDVDRWKVARRMLGLAPVVEETGRRGGMARDMDSRTVQVARHLVRGMADGDAPRVDRIRAAGNGVVPMAAAHAWRTLAATLADAR